mgnify:CR=1 FL=1
MSKEQLTIDEEPVIKERKRGIKDSGGFLSSLGIDLSDIEVKITLNPEDKALLQSSLKEISDKVDYRWKVTQGIMIAAILLGIAGQVINWL